MMAFIIVTLVILWAITHRIKNAECRCCRPPWTFNSGGRRYCGRCGSCLGPDSDDKP